MIIVKTVGWAICGGLAAGTVAVAAIKLLEKRRNAGVARGKKIVIVGGGFGGAAVAAELARLLPDPANGSVTLIDEDSFLLFTPMLTEAAGGAMETRHIAVPLRGLPKRIQLLQGAVTKVDLASRTVTVKVSHNGVAPQETQITADHLVIALGSVTNYHHTPGVAEHALGVKRLEDASAVCQRVLDCLERAKTEHDESRRKALLTFVVAGGGFTGVETMAAINSLVREQVAKTNVAAKGEVRTILVNPGDRLLGEISPELAAYATHKLKQRGVDIRMKTSITGASATTVDVKPGEPIPANTLIWAAGVMPNPIVSQLDCEKGKHGGIKVNGCCQVTEREGVWAIGDCAEIPNPAGKPGTYAPTAQNATREGALVAQNIVSALKGASPRPFTFKTLGELALVGKYTGVARLLGFNISGVLAWALWRGVYLSKMPGTVTKARVIGDWTREFVFGRFPVPIDAQAILSNSSTHVGLQASTSVH